MIPEFPIYPNFPQLPSIPSPGPMPSGIGAANNATLAGTFTNLMQKVSTEMQTPHSLARDMMTGKRKFDTAELMIAITEAERKLNTTVRIMNELVKGIKQLESIQI